MDNSARDPCERRRDQHEESGDRRYPNLLHERQPRADAVKPIGDLAPDHLGVDRDFLHDGDPELRIDDAGGSCEGFAREQLTSSRADARAEVVGLQQHGAGGAQVGVQRVVPLLLAREFLCRDVGRGLGLARFGR